MPASLAECKEYRRLFASQGDAFTQRAEQHSAISRVSREHYFINRIGGGHRQQEFVLDEYASLVISV